MSCDKPALKLPTRERNEILRCIATCPYCKTHTAYYIATWEYSASISCSNCKVSMEVDHKGKVLKSKNEEYVVYAYGGRGNPKLIGWDYGRGNMQINPYREVNSFIGYTPSRVVVGKPRTVVRIGRWISKISKQIGGK